MTIPVWVEQQNGTFTASVLGASQLRAEGPTKDQAITALVAVLSNSQASGQLVLVEVPGRATVARVVAPLNAQEVAAWREMCAEIYRERDQQKRLDNTNSFGQEVLHQDDPAVGEAAGRDVDRFGPGAPQLREDGRTKDEALTSLHADLVRLLMAGKAAGELVLVDSEPKGLMAAAGAFKDDPTLDDIVREAYRYRDELKAQEFPE